MLVQLVPRGVPRHFTCIFSGTVHFLGRLGLSVRGCHTHGESWVPLLLDSKAWNRSRPVEICSIVWQCRLRGFDEIWRVEMVHAGWLVIAGCTPFFCLQEELRAPLADYTVAFF